jgi:2,4-dienoyl-CoA reductase-like NADH-dependent reductase (Old Yellow Enzyme family)
MIQITHLGRRTGWGQDNWLPVVAPSRLREPAHRNHPKEAEQWDIDRIVGEYADAAERMVAGGMDGIEIESYGHLFDQFWSPATNRRTDLYGGSVENRMRFSLEVLHAVRRRIGPDVVLGLRMAVDERLHEAGVDGFDESAGLAMLRRVCADGLIDFVNVIRGNVADEVALTEVIPIHGMASAPHLDVVGRVKGMLAATNPQVAVLHAAKVYRPQAKAPHLDKDQTCALRYLGKERWAVLCDDRTVAEYAMKDLRIAIVYRARCFADAFDTVRQTSASTPLCTLK